MTASGVEVLSATPAPREADREGARALDVAVDALRRWRADPSVFVREVFDLDPPTPDAWQDEALRAFPATRRLCMRACKGPGKTTTMAWLGWNFLGTRPRCKVPCTSITEPNLRDGLWAEFKKWQSKSTLLSRAFRWLATRIVQVDQPETWFASARGWAKDADPQAQADSLAGVHEDYLLWLLDEVSEMPDGVVSAAEAALASGVETRIVIAGNCTRTEGPLYRACVTDRRLWHVVTITGDPDDPRRSPRIDIEEARLQIEKYGRASYVVKVNILGEFPDRQPDRLLDVADIAAAMRRHVPRDVWEGQPKVIGVDVARFGDDASIFFPRQGRMSWAPKELRGLDTVELGRALIASIQKWGAHAAMVDGGGVGAGTIDYSRSAGWGHIIHEVQFGSAAADPVRFENKRVEMYWRAAEHIKGGGALPDDPQLAAELIAPRYWYDKRGRICLDPKSEIKARLGRSPDRADGYVCTFAVELGPVSQLSDTYGDGSRSGDYDPYAAVGESAVVHTRDYDPFQEAGL